MKYNDTVILLFAKAPVEGKVNTRLIADIGVQAATLLQRDLIDQRLSMLTQANLCAVTLMCSPDVQDDYFVHCKQQYPITLLAQSGADLGVRMFNGIKQVLQQYQYCIVIGTDAPALDEVLISQAIEGLKTGNEVVFVPAEDGGYVLIAMQHAHAFLFQDINWGSADVMQQTRSKLDENGVSFEELASCWDVDRLEDYQRYLTLIKNNQGTSD